MSVETNPHNYTNMNNTFSQFFNPARISPKENSGASGGFLPNPLLLRLRHPNSKKNQPRFCQILSPKNSFGKTESALVPPPARILGGQNPERKTPFPFSEKIHPRQIRNARSVFSFGVSAEALRGGGGTIHSSSGLVSKKVRAKDTISPHLAFIIG